MVVALLFSFLLFLSTFSLSSCANISDTSASSYHQKSLERAALTTEQNSSATKKDLLSPQILPQLLKDPEHSPSPEELQQTLNEAGTHWFYGHGLGRTIVNVGTIVLFPPYAIYLLGNAGLELAGFKPLYVTDALPETPRENVLSVYNGVTSVPGRITSAVSGREFESE